MPTDLEIGQTLAAVAARLNDEGLDRFDAGQVQRVVTAALGESSLTVDDGGGLHDQSGARIGAIHRTDSGEWIVDGQNRAAPRSGAPIPARRSRNPVRSLLGRLRP